MEAIATAWTVTVQERTLIQALIATIGAVYVSGYSQAATIVDEKESWARFVNLSFYAAGACAGLTFALQLMP